uniref:Uncharacterized protein n=1 Tax=Anopheles farauti TaxID=69004 RepID=A0A182QB24_9DIPT
MTGCEILGRVTTAEGYNESGTEMKGSKLGWRHDTTRLRVGDMHVVGNKRRSSIAVVFLGGGRKDSSAKSAASPVSGSSNGHHHHHSGHSISTIPEKYSRTGESDIENDAPNGGDTFVMVGEPGSNGGTNLPDVPPPGYDKKRRRSSSWQTKLERRRRKGMMASLDGNDAAQQDSASFSSFGSVQGLDSSPYSAPGPAGKFGREKRHSWWNIFVPDNLKQR